MMSLALVAITSFYRKPHAHGRLAREDVAEIAGRHHEDRRRAELRGGREVIDALRRDAREVDRVDRREVDSRGRIRVSANSAFTMAWASSKLPSSAILWTLAKGAVVIWRRCTSLTRPLGCSTKTSIFGSPPRAAMAAEPVSPEVAARTVARPPRCFSARANSRPNTCSAISLKAKRGAVKQLQQILVAAHCAERRDVRRVQSRHRRRRYPSSIRSA